MNLVKRKDNIFLQKTDSVRRARIEVMLCTLMRWKTSLFADFLDRVTQYAVWRGQQ